MLAFERMTLEGISPKKIRNLRNRISKMGYQLKISVSGPKEQALCKLNIPFQKLIKSEYLKHFDSNNDRENWTKRH